VIFPFIEQHRHLWPVTVLCQTLGVSAQGFYAWRSRPASDQQRRRDALLVEIRAVHAEVKQRYGSPRSHAELVAKGVDCCVNTVAKLMHDNDIRAKTARQFKNSTDSAHSLPVADNLLGRHFEAQGPNERWLRRGPPPQEVPFVEALLRPYLVEVHGGLTTSGAISRAEASLLTYPERPVAIIINADREAEPPEATRLGIKRILARAYPENWCVAVPVPNLVAWAMTDPRIKREIEALDPRTYYIHKAARVSELVQEQPFDAGELYRGNADFRGLIEFLQKHAPAAPAAASRAASS
jgi:hypothetical protein